MTATSYSFQGQDRFVVEALGGLRGGYFVDSGASNGVRGSNSLLLESEYGWRGLCIEPNRAMFAELVGARTCTCVNECLYDRADNVAFLEGAGVLGGILETYEPRHLDYARSVVTTAADDPTDDGISVRATRRIAEILAEHGAPRSIDYWSLDTEGSELAILRSFPFERYEVKVITVEHNHAPVRLEIRALLEAKGYRLARNLGIDDAYVLGSVTAAKHWRSKAWRV